MTSPGQSSPIQASTFNQSVIDRFWAKVHMTDSCWLWTGRSTYDGYGLIHVNGRRVRAHRLSWELANGPSDVNLQMCHSCDTPACVNPSHLRLGTAQDNADDRESRGRGNPPHRGQTHCQHGHILSGDNVRIQTGLKGGVLRHCKQCHSDYRRERRRSR